MLYKSKKYIMVDGTIGSQQCVSHLCIVSNRALVVVNVLLFPQWCIKFEYFLSSTVVVSLVPGYFSRKAGLFLSCCFFHFLFTLLSLVLKFTTDSFVIAFVRHIFDHMITQLQEDITMWCTSLITLLCQNKEYTCMC